jgi:hypothetical protein
MPLSVLGTHLCTRVAAYYAIFKQPSVHTQRPKMRHRYPQLFELQLLPYAQPSGKDSIVGISRLTQPTAYATEIYSAYPLTLDR